MKPKLALLLLLLPGWLFGQSLEIDSTTEQRTYSVTVVSVKAPDTAQIRVQATDKNRIPVDMKKLDDRQYEIRSSKPQVWFRVTCIDFKSQFFDDKEVVLVLDGDNIVPPDDDDDGKDDDTDPPDPPDKYDGPNALGLGKLSYDHAPRFDNDVVKIYKAAGDYLFARPELKVMKVQSDDPRKNTDFVLPVWIKQQMDQKVAQNSDWERWYMRVMQQAFKLNREKKITSLRDWYSAWNEIAAGVEARK